MGRKQPRYLAGAALGRHAAVGAWLSLLVLFCMAMLSPMSTAQAGPPTCGPFNIVVVHGGSFVIDASGCDALGFGGVGVPGATNPSTPATNGTVSISTIANTVTYSHFGGGNNAISDMFVFKDASNNLITVNVTIGAASSITISPSSLTMRAGEAFSETLIASGGIGPYTYTLDSGAFPVGIGINPATGEISGTPTARGLHSFTIKATDSTSASGVQSYSLTVANPTITLAPASPIAAFVGVPVNLTFTASGGVAPYTITYESGTLPAGLSMTGDDITGTPTTVESRTFVVKVADASSGPGTYHELENVTINVTNPPPPTLASIAPTSGPTAGGTAVTLTGTGFVPGTTVTIGGAAATGITVVNDTTITAATPAYVSGALAKDVVVNNGVVSVTLAGGFTYVAPAPTLASIAPTSGPTAGGTAVTLTGTGFVPGTTVTIGGVAATGITVVNATTITAATPAYVSGALAKDVVVNNGVGSATLAGGFTYVAPAPTLASIAPTSGPTAGGTAVTLTGTGFVPGTTVTIDGVAATGITVVNATTITAATPAYVSGALAKDVVVNNGVGSATLAGGFTYVAPAPTLASIAPNSGPAAGGTAVTLTGTGFVPGTTVTIGGVAATGITVVNATTITAATPAHASGAVDIVVTTSGGTATGTGLYTYVAPVTTTTAITSSQNPSVSGASVTFTATVTAASGPAPTGDVTFMDGATTLGVATLSGATASFSTTTLSVGTHAITAAYGGNGTSAASVSPVLNQQVGKAASTVTLNVAPNPAQVGQNVTLTATVAASAGTPTGNVIFRDGTTVLGTDPLAGATASFSTATLAPGVHSLTATYDGDATFLTSVSSAQRLTVKRSCNDTFATALQVTGASGSAAGSTVGATGENGEPSHAGDNGALNSVWCAWTAPATGDVTFDTTGSLFDTTLAVYTGQPVWSLTLVAANDNIAATTKQSRVTFAAVQGTTYMVAVDGVGAAVGDYLLTWTQAPASPSLYSSVLPTSRSVLTGSTATAFATIINAGSVAAGQCTIALPPGFPASLSFQTTTPANDPVGLENAPVDIQPGAVQNFVFGITPTVDLNAADVALVFTCANAQPAPSVPGLNTLTLSSSSLPTPDILAIGSTLSNDGIVTVPVSGVSLFGTAAVNIGAPGTVTASVDDDGRNLPLTVTLCRSDPATAACLPGVPPAATQRLDMANGQVVTFTVYVAATAPVAFSPAVNRLQLRIKTDDGVTRGATSVAVRTQ